MNPKQVILLADCDCFFVSCERLDHPELRGKPVAVVTSVGPRGIVVSRSPEAKKLGLKVGQPVFQFRSEFPEVVCVAERLSRYHTLSKQVMDVLRQFTPDVEPVSIDEAYLNITGFDQLKQCSYAAYARQIRQAVWEQVGIPVSIGMSLSKTLAKLASDKAKRAGGLFVISPQNLTDVLSETKLEEICGIGKRLLPRYHQKDIWTVLDLMAKSPQWMLSVFGVNGERLRLELEGVCLSPVCAEEEAPQSIQVSRAFDVFTQNQAVLSQWLPAHVHQASRKMRHWNGFCQTLGVMVRTKDFKLFEKEIVLSAPTNSEVTLIQESERLLKSLCAEITRRYPRAIYRAVGVTLKKINYGEPIQYALFDAVQTEDDPLSRAIDALEEKFGKQIVKFGQ